VDAALSISGDAIFADLEALAAFSEPGAGVTRLAWSPELQAANAWLSERMASLDLAVDVDAAGNVFGRWEAGTGAPVLVGSHLDSVPQGGRFDGPLGVVSALHAVAALQAAGVRPQRPIWVVSWTDEEGARFGTSLFGSRAFAGQDVSGEMDRVDVRGVRLADAMRAWGLPPGGVADARGIDGIGAYLELHIEQGPRLHDAGIDVGVVTGLVGLQSHDVVFHGQANHAGTTPMAARRDALAAAARTVLAIREEALRRPGTVANVGHVAVRPGAANVIPGRAELIVEMRAEDRETWEQIPAIVRATVDQAALAEGVGVTFTERYRLPPAAFSDELAGLAEEAARVEGASATRMSCGAGHDGMSLADRVPVSMILVPSVAGISHAPDEFSDPEACAIGARVLARMLMLLTGRTAESRDGS
jgi:hydantoinase/carbamoylase family amidase